MAGILSAADRERIFAAVSAVERGTAAEIVIAVLPRSAPYDRRRAGTALLLALLLLPVLHPTSAILAGLFAWWLLGWTPLLRMVLVGPYGRALMGEAVHQKSMQLFAEQGIYRTRERSGLLIFISELERRVAILGDEGIHAHVGTEGWKTYVDEIIVGIRQRRAVDAILGVLERLGATLALHFPRGPDDEDELPNAVVTQEGAGGRTTP